MGKNNSIQWLKAIILVSGLLFAKLVLASDTTGIEDLNKQATAAEQMIEFIAKWGGIAMIVVTVLAIGFGKAKGEVAYVLCAVGISIGGLSAAWGWFGESFAHGFVF
ncbi:MAG: hypothetical protein KBD25_01130 [Rickettsiaceae bacterium]|nr:hypothetical protein [Rickettsiaceae bacterium]